MREFKKPDVKAPRYRQESYNIEDKKFFEKFKKKHPKYKDVDVSKLKQVIKLFNQTIYQTVIDTRDGVELPESIGWLFIGACQQSKKPNIDFAKSKKYGVAVTNKNWETDGKLAKIFFSTYAPRHRMKNREFWGFVACRDFKRLVAKTFPENWNNYIAVDPDKKLKKQYITAYLKDKNIRQTKESLKDYKDFEL